MASEAIRQFNPSDYVEMIRGKIRGVLLEVVPDEQWDEMIRKEIQTFFELRTEDRSYGYSVRTSGFRMACEDILKREVQERVLAALKSPEWDGYWDGQRQTIGPKLAELLQQQAAGIFNAWLGSVLQGVLHGMQIVRP